MYVPALPASWFVREKSILDQYSWLSGVLALVNSCGYGKLAGLTDFKGAKGLGMSCGKVSRCIFPYDTNKRPVSYGGFARGLGDLCKNKF